MEKENFIYFTSLTVIMTDYAVLHATVQEDLEARMNDVKPTASLFQFSDLIPLFGINNLYKRTKESLSKMRIDVHDAENNSTEEAHYFNKLIKYSVRRKVALLANATYNAYLIGYLISENM